MSEDKPYLFFAERQWRDSVILQLIIIGEATKHLSAELRKRHSEVAWRSMAALRDVLVHSYMGTDLDVVWDVAVHMLPQVKLRVEAILAEEPPG